MIENPSCFAQPVINDIKHMTKIEKLPLVTVQLVTYLIMHILKKHIN